MSRVAISACVAELIAMMSNQVYHWKTAGAFAILMTIAKELNTGPGLVAVINVRIRTRPQRTTIQMTLGSLRLFTKKVMAHYKESMWYVI